ncbi:hypothetical protein N323_03804 [Cathartes aura]|uniref:Uncharacterized protein n=1 Tax=Cathartes aura TaxID=43455 RepID=A0A091L9B0_CATAU|nr:hypothetical protein N323_03804 [Cathartes aura]
MRRICHQWPLKAYMRIILGECEHIRTKHDCQKYPASNCMSCCFTSTIMRNNNAVGIPSRLLRATSPSTEDCRLQCYESPKIEIGNNSAELPGGSRTETLARREALGCKGTAPPSVTCLYK